MKDENDSKDGVTIDDLIATASGKRSTPDRIKNTRKSNELQHFLVANDIKDGPDLVYFPILYAIYSKWSNYPMASMSFNKYLRKYLKFKTFNPYYHCYYIDASKIGLPSYYRAWVHVKFQKDNYERVRAIKFAAKFTGVRALPAGGYSATVMYPDGKPLTVGIYRSVALAAFAYDKAAYQIYGKAAKLNYPNRVKEHAENYKKAKSKNPPKQRKARNVQPKADGGES